MKNDEFSEDGVDLILRDFGGVLMMWLYFNEYS